ncbi:MAG: nucleotidyltransferase domain-containing protein [Candidatus Thorarchaeota archaeon]
MRDIQNRFKAALDDTVKEWKNHEKAKGIFVYGSFAKGTATADSDLDISIIWDAAEAPVRLMSTHKEVRLDMVFMTIGEIEDVFSHTTSDVLKVSEVVNRFRTSHIIHDPKGMLKKWQKSAIEYSWPVGTINEMKKAALEPLSRAKRFVAEDDYASAIYEMREGLFQFGRLILMSNNIFTVLRPAEVLTEIRMLDPITYQLFLRTYKLRGLDESKLLVILEKLRTWIERAETRLEESEDTSLTTQATRLLAQAQRQYHGSLNLTYGGDYELAALEMREAANTLGKAMVVLKGEFSPEKTGFIDNLRDSEMEFFNQILVEYGAYDIQPAEISRIINEAEFLAHRI